MRDSDIFADQPGPSDAFPDADIFADVSPDVPAVVVQPEDEAGWAEVVGRGLNRGIRDFGLGLYRGARDLIDGPAYLASKGVRAVAPGVADAVEGVGQTINAGLRDVLPDTLADRLLSTQSPSDVNKWTEAEYQSQTPGSVAAGVGRLGGNVVASLVPVLGQVSGAQKANAAWQAGRTAESLLRAGALGSAQGIAYGTRTDDDSLGWNAVGGALGGGAGQVVSGGVGAGIRWANRAMAGESGRAGQMLLDAANDPAAVRRALSQTGELVPGSVPMTHQLAQDPGISQLYRTAVNAGAKGIGEREAAQNAARLAALDRVSPGGRTAIEAAETAGQTIRGEAETLRRVLKDAIRGAYNVPALQAIELTPPAEHLTGIAKQMYPAKVPQPAEFKSVIEALTGGEPMSFAELQSIRSFVARKATSLANSDATQAAAFAKVRDALDSLPDAAAESGQIDEVAAQAFKVAKGLRTALGQRYETGPAKGLWERGADGLPKRQGAEVSRGFFHSGPSQRADVDQLFRMLPGNDAARDALRDYALADLREHATNASGTLSSGKYNAWVRRRAEALPGVLTEGERDVINRVGQDLWRADRGAGLGMARGSNTVQNALGSRALESRLVRSAMHRVPFVGPLAGPVMDALTSSRRQANTDALGRVILDPRLAQMAIEDAQRTGVVPEFWSLGLGPGLLGATVPTGMLGAGLLGYEAQ